MRHKIIAYPLRIALCIVLGGLIATTVTAAPKLHEFEYNVISAAINHGVNDPAAKIIIDETTTGEAVNISDPGTTTAELAAGLGTTIAALDEWSRINKRRYTLTGQLTTVGNHHLLSEDERSKLFNDEDPATNWKQFNTRFPNAAGIIRVSRPGLDDTAGSAILYLEFQCGAQCGSGRLVNLVLTDSGQWQVTTGTLVWITSPE
jgi:hypothetical protein